MWNPASQRSGGRRATPWAGGAAACAVVGLLASVGHASTGSEPVDVRHVAVPGTTTVLRLWEGADANGNVVPHYAVSFDGERWTQPVATSYTLKLRHGDFDPLGDAPAPAIEAGFEAGDDTNLYLVQFVTQPLEEFRAAIRELGGVVHFYMGNHGHIVKMSPAVREQVAQLPFVRWVGAYHPAYRLEEFMLDNAAVADELYPLQRYNIRVMEAGLEQKTSLAARVRALGGMVDRVDAGKYMLEATLTPEQLFEIVRADEVLFIDRWSPYESDMNNARSLGGANYIEAVGGFDGTGVRGEVFDTGFNRGHVDFASRPLITHGSAPTGSHGASTSGICFGDGTGSAIARGLLPEGQGIVAGASGILGSTTNRYNHTRQLVLSPYYAVFQTSSVGSNRTTAYTNLSANMDDALFDFDISHCQSQSNAGNRQSRPQAWAKNIISGGGVFHFNTSGTGDDCWCGGASIGPASDGRIKPTLVGFYDSINTTTCCGSTSYTSSFGGTSGATPIICGHVGLFYHMWSEGIFGNPVTPGGTGGQVFANRAHMSTAKAMLVNTARQYPFTGTSHDLTRMHQGWGTPDLQRMYDERNNMLVIDETEVLSVFQSASYQVDVPAGTTQLKATLVYSDPAGVPASSRHRINDLNLKVTAWFGTTFWGNNGLASSVWSSPVGVANTIDTVENVIISTPPPGTWTVEVFAAEVNQDGHVETPQLDVDFALVVTGISGLVACPEDVNGDGTVNVFDLLAVLAAWGPCGGCPEDINGDGTVNVFDLLAVLAAWGPC